MKSEETIIEEIYIANRPFGYLAKDGSFSKQINSVFNSIEEIYMPNFLITPHSVVLQIKDETTKEEIYIFDASSDGTLYQYNGPERSVIGSIDYKSGLVSLDANPLLIDHPFSVTLSVHIEKD